MKLPKLSLRDLAPKWSRLVASGMMTPRNAAHQFMDELGANPSQISEAYGRLTPDIQAELIAFAEQPERDWLASHFSRVLANPVSIEPPMETPPSHPARVAFAALCDYVGVPKRGARST